MLVKPQKRLFGGAIVILVMIFLCPLFAGAQQQTRAARNAEDIEKLKAEIRKLQEAVKRLNQQGEFAAPRPDSTQPAAADSAALSLEAELAKALGESGAPAAPPQPATSPPAQALRGSVSRSGSTLNPRISVIGTFFGASTSADAVAKTNDIGLAEAEISFQSYVDPYAKADFFVAFGHETEDPFAGPEAEAGFSGEFAPELEEAFLTSLSLPFSLQVKAGKFLSTFGKINSTHSHAWNFLDTPRMYVNYLSEEGLADRGLSINWLVPNPFGFFQELSFEALSGAAEAASFAGTKDLLYLLHLKNFFDVNENTTLELGLTGLHGSNDAARHKSTIGAVDLTLRWKPLRMNRYKSIEWMTEALLSRRDTPAGRINSTALYSFLRYQVAKRWFLGARYDYSEFPENGDAHESAYSAIASFFATEFQKIELQFQHGVPVDRNSFNRLLLRAVFVIGAHGAHKY